MKGVLTGIVVQASVRQTKAGKDYLSVMVEQSDETAAKKSGPVWVTSCDTHLLWLLSAQRRLESAARGVDIRQVGIRR